MYKIIFSDIDGTLLGPKRELTKPTIKEIQKLKNKIPFILVSSRMPRQMYHLQEELDVLELPLIAFNGAYVVQKKKVIHSTEIPVGIIEKLVNENEKNGSDKIHISLFNADDWYVDSMDYWALREETNTKTSPEVKTNKDVVSLWKSKEKGAHKIMCMGDKDKIDAIYTYLEENYGAVLHLYRSKETYIEIANKEVSKLTGINKLLNCCYPDFTLEETVAFGDNYNDVEMIAAVGCGVAVANARKEVLSVAKAVTEHHKEDGVAIYLKKLFNS
ncbi:HAD family hydrolase [Galbibacter sp. PAP.153]|uniref:HAD family hydrolase n=1 Tax=Galbibacter sp. PAP.153 TaxID=3104623 RepID=UPI0030084A69